MFNNFIRGVIDGSLSTLGVLIGASAGSPGIIISAGMGGAVANGISNMLGAFSAEKAKKYGKLRKVERAMVSKSLKDSVLDLRIGPEVKKAGVVDGIATIVGGLIPVMPYLFMPASLAMFLSIALVLFILFFLGLYIGKLAKENIILSAIKMVVFGVVVAVIAFLIQYTITPPA